jgi:RNA polymerase-binding protein DksA
MDDGRRSRFRETLLAERERLLQEIVDAAPEAPGQMTYGSQAAMASEVFAQQRDLALRDRSTRQLEAVDAALVRLDEGTFGTCRNCGRPIAEQRLEARPWAPLCIDCQRLEDR